MSWMQRLKRVFAIDIESCPDCGGKLRVIASIEDMVPMRRDDPAAGIVVRLPVQRLGAAVRLGHHGIALGDQAGFARCKSSGGKCKIRHGVKC